MTLNEKIWKQYCAGLDFNNKLRLVENVANNENFFIGKQWEGVVSNGLPTPVFNILKQIVLHQVATITSDNFTISATPLRASANDKRLEMASQVVNSELRALFKVNKLPNLSRIMMRNAAVDGDGCMFTYFDPDAPTGLDGIKGAIKTEIIDNTRVLFGNPNSRNVQSQPYIIIWKRRQICDVKDEARANGLSEEEIQNISADTDDNNSRMDSYVDDKCTVLTKLWRDKKTGTIWGCEVTKGAVIRKPYDVRIKSYPVTWICWDYVQECYHGQALITGLIPNQEFINKAYAMAMLSQMTSAFPTKLFDRTRITKWTNQVGAQIAVDGSVEGVAKILEPAQISPQIAQFINSTIENTQSLTGATAAALGNTRPDNTSAIIALQRAAAIPAEITKQNLYECLEDLGRIYIEFMAAYYGTRPVDIPAAVAVGDEIAQFANANVGMMQQEFDFAQLEDCPMTIGLDVGASSYWSEVASMQTLENLLQLGLITVADFLERIPDGYVAKRQELLDKYKQKEMAALMPAVAPESDEDVIAQDDTATEIPETSGNSELQREVAADV